MNKELIEAINLLEKENNISKDVLLEAIENSLLTAYKNNYGRADNVKVNITVKQEIFPSWQSVRLWKP